MSSHGTTGHELWLDICGSLNVSSDPLMPNICIIEYISNESDMKWNESFCTRTTNWWDVISHERSITQTVASLNKLLQIIDILHKKKIIYVHTDVDDQVTTEGVVYGFVSCVMKHVSFPYSHICTTTLKLVKHFAIFQELDFFCCSQSTCNIVINWL